MESEHNNYTISLNTFSLQRVENASFAASQLEKVNDTNYPGLSAVLRARRGVKLQRLRNILEYLARPEEASFAADDGKAYTDIPARELVGLYGGSHTTYTAVLNFCCLTGLMEKHNPNRLTNTTKLDQEARSYAAHKRRELGIKRKHFYNARVYYHLPRWTEDLLQAAEEKARGSAPTLTRAVDLYGGEAARQRLDTWRGIPRETERAREAIEKYVAEALSKKGYTTKGEILRAVHLRREKPRPGERKTIDLEPILTAFIPEMCKRHNLRYHPPTAEERQRLQLTGRGWILTERDNAPDA